jgi:hydrogenase maturation protease
MNERILIAGIGNIFFGDDAFGVEVVRELERGDLAKRKPVVRVVDFGIRSYDLAYALTEGYEAIILVDAVPRGGAAGTVYLIEPDPSEAPKSDTELLDAHSLNPVSVLQLAQTLGGIKGKIFLVGCEPACLEPGELSASVHAAIPHALETIEELVCELLGEEEEKSLRERGQAVPESGA